MQIIDFPATDLRPSVLALGVAEYGSQISSDDSFAMLDAFAEAGGNIADSAHIYASWLPDGRGQSERTLGKWLQSRRPKNFLVSTKGGHPDLETMEVSRLSPECIACDLNESLERLQRESIDLYWLHRDDAQVPVDEILDSLNEHLKAGRIRALGASNWSTARILEANEQAERRGLTGFCASQIGWSLAQINDAARGAGDTIQMDEQTLAWHRSSGFPVMAYSSQANGFFAHALPAKDEPKTEMTAKQKSLAGSYLNDENRKRHARATLLSTRMSRTPNEIALAYLWSQSFPAVAIIGPRSLPQLRNSLQATDLRLSPDEVAELEHGG